jgi:bacterioferritin
VTATGIASEAVKQEFAEHAREEGEHLDWLCERINQLGGKPNMNPDGLLSRAASEYVEGENLVDMIKENLVAERVAIQTYRDMVRYFGDKDPTTRILLERILAQEEEHANDMHDLLVSHEGRPMLDK